MQKHDDVVQNLNGNVIIAAPVQVVVAGTNTPATIFADASGLTQLNNLKTDALGQFGFYAPNGRYDVFVMVGGKRVAHASDVLMYDPEDDERLTSTGSGSGSGSGGSSGGASLDMTEVAITAASDGSITLNKSQALNFSITLSGNAKLLNPVGYSAGDRIKVVARQDAQGSRLLTYDLKYAVPGAQPPALSTTALSIDLIQIDVTTGANGLEYLLTPYLNNYAAVLPLARIGATLYYKFAGLDGLGAFSHIQPGDACYVVRNGKGPEATGTIAGTSVDSTYLLAGAPVGDENSADRRPLLHLLPDTRPAFGKALINCEGSQTITIRDLRLSGARNSDNNAIGISMSQSGDLNNVNVQHITVSNVEITDCNNGILTGNDSVTGSLSIADCLFDKNGVGGPSSVSSEGYNTSGFVHNIYMGHTHASLTITRSTFSRSITGHDIKTRADITTLSQVLATGSYTGRELNAPNGGRLYATNCTFWKTGDATQNNLVGIGEEGIDTTRPTEYIFTNCRFQNDITQAGRDVTFVINMDQNVAMHFIDCEFIGDVTLNNSLTAGGFDGMTTAGGFRYFPGKEPVFTLTGGPIGPVLPVGYFPVAMTPVAG